MKDYKTTIKIIAVILSIAAVVSLIIVYREQIASFFNKVKEGCDGLAAKFKKPADYDFYDDVDF